MNSKQAGIFHYFITCQTVVTSNFQYLRYLYQRDRENELYKVTQFFFFFFFFFFLFFVNRN